MVTPRCILSHSTSSPGRRWRRFVWAPTPSKSRRSPRRITKWVFYWTINSTLAMVLTLVSINYVPASLNIFALTTRAGHQYLQRRCPHAHGLRLRGAGRHEVPGRQGPLCTLLATPATLDWNPRVDNFFTSPVGQRRQGQRGKCSKCTSDGVSRSFPPIYENRPFIWLMKPPPSQFTFSPEKVSKNFDYYIWIGVKNASK